MEINHLRKYFKAEGADPVLCDYIEKSYERLLEGHIVTDASEDTVALSQSEFVSKTGDQPFVLDENRFYFQRYFSYETDIIDWVQYRVVLNQEVFAHRKAKLQAYKKLIITL